MSIKFALKFAACLVLAGCFPLFSAAQQTPPSSDSSQQASPTSSQQQTPPPAQNQPPATTQQPADKDSSKDADKNKGDQSQNGQGKVEGTSNDRLFYTLPNFLTMKDNGKLPPLSVKDKFKVVALGSFDPVEYPWWGIIAAIGQASNGDPAYGQGWVSYAKRYGVTASDSLIENFMVGAVYPSMLHQDPRYYQSGHGRFVKRTGYSISRIFVTRSDSGHKQFNFSEIVGAYTAACISTYSYHARSAIINGKFVGSERTFDNTVSTWGTQLSLDTLTLVIKEFWPDIHRKMAHKHNGDAGVAAPKP